MFKLFPCLAALIFEISPENYNLRLCTENDIALNQEIFNLFLTDMNLTYSSKNKN